MAGAIWGIPAVLTPSVDLWAKRIVRLGLILPWLTIFATTGVLELQGGTTWPDSASLDNLFLYFVFVTVSNALPFYLYARFVKWWLSPVGGGRPLPFGMVALFTLCVIGVGILAGAIGGGGITAFASPFLIALVIGRQVLRELPKATVVAGLIGLSLMTTFVNAVLWYMPPEFNMIYVLVFPLVLLGGFGVAAGMSTLIYGVVAAAFATRVALSLFKLAHRFGR